MSEDITQDPEYIRGYERAKQRMEGNYSPFIQGWHAAYEEAYEKEKEKEKEESTPDPYMQMLKSIDGRLAKLEKYTQE